MLMLIEPRSDESWKDWSCSKGLNLSANAYLRRLASGSHWDKCLSSCCSSWNVVDASRCRAGLKDVDWKSFWISRVLLLAWKGELLKYSERNCKKRLLRSKNEFRFKFNEIRWRHQHSQRFSMKNFRQKQQINLVWIGSFAQCFIVNLDSHDSV